MDKTAIRNFAVWARRKLIDDIKQKAYEIGITEKEIKEAQVVTSDTMIIGDRTLSKAEMEQRKSLLSRIAEKGFANTVEEVAYTWFNRFIALRFMEVNEYLPTGVRVLSSTEQGRKEPDILKQALSTDLDLDRELVYKLQDANETEVLFRYLLVKQCNALNDILPGLFEEIEDYTEILLPSNLLTEGSIIRQLVESISEDDFMEQVEIIGWMYQYYISEKKDEVFEGLKKNIKITRENIPAATQLFTPAWIVKYMVENSLGRLWLEGHPDDDLKSKWQYYLEEAEQEPEVQRRLEEIRAGNRELRPEEIKVLDPSMGSGHILVYAFDVLYDIYKSSGYSERDIPRLILANNLYGLDIDDRAAQLAYFAVMMKARSKSRRIFREKINLNILSIQESNDFPSEAAAYLSNTKGSRLGKSVNRDDVEYLINVFFDAREYGSILEVRDMDFDAIEQRLEEIRDGEAESLLEYGYRNVILEKLPVLIKQARIMSRKYDVVVTNPPYMGIKQGMNSKIISYVEKNFPYSKYDLYSIFIEVCLRFAKQSKMIAMITQHTWMFLSSYQKLREKLLHNTTISSMAHLGTRAFEEISGEVVQTTSFVLRNDVLGKYKGMYHRLVDFDAKDKELKFLQGMESYSNIAQECFFIADGCPVVYWVSDNFLDVFNHHKTLSTFCTLKNGPDAKGNNERYFKLWYEVDFDKIRLDHTKDFDSYTWFPFNKGGSSKWYGSNIYICFREFCTSNRDFFRNGITWSDLVTNFSCRLLEKGFAFNNHGKMCFVEDSSLEKYILGFLNTKVALSYIHLFTVRTKYEIGYVGKVPCIISRDSLDRVNALVEECIALCRDDWNTYETSWNFEAHPIIGYKKDGDGIKEAFDKWKESSESRFNRMKEAEEELNRIFIDIYHLESELDSEIDEKNVTVKRAEREKDIKSFISYAVGCMFGRFSVNADSIIYAGGEWTEKWKVESGERKVRKAIKDQDRKSVDDIWVDAAFIPDKDNVIPVTDDEYFEDDIVSRFVRFLKVTFGEDTLEENLDYIAETLGRKASETARQAIRRYFLKDFYRDHVQAYQKKPVYWLFDSGRQDGFKALIYMHRYDEFTAARVRTDYLHSLQKSYEAEVRRLDIVIDSNASEREKANARKKKEKIFKQMEECRQYDQIIAHIANQRISIDLDDGVSMNYARFQGVEIPQGEGKKPVKADLLAKI